ncbi:MAG: cellulose-binding protein CttA-related protein, partial [Oscillospiraceae bacterium]|nr:cellulose-binding protein CttA-related protein [Oscillospiraceae bacterium]
TTSDPNGGTTTTSDPNGGTTTTSDPNGGTTTTSDPNGGTTTTSDPNGGTTTTSDTTPTETTTTEPTPVNVKDIKFEVEGDTQGNRNFYFSHDPRPFEVEDLVKSAKVVEVTTVDGKEVEEEIDVDMSKISFGLDKDTSDEALSPEDVVAKLKDDGQEFAYTLMPLYIFYDGEVAETQVYVYIGVKGDVNFDGVADAEDATNILIYSAEYGSGNKNVYIMSATNQALEAFAWFLGDVTGESKDCGKTSSVEGQESSDLDAEDATDILIYSAEEGGGKKVDWVVDILGVGKDSTELPKYTKAIHDWKVANQK